MFPVGEKLFSSLMRIPLQIKKLRFLNLVRAPTWAVPGLSKSEES